MRRAVFEPLPQKRAGPSQSGEAMPPPPPRELTARTQPGDESSYNTGSASWSLPPPGQENTGRTDPGADPSQPGLAARMPPAPQENTGRTDPGNEQSHPGAAYRGSENATRTAPPEEPLREETREQVVSSPEVRTARLAVPQQEDAHEEDSHEEDSHEEVPHEAGPHEEDSDEEIPPDDRTRPIRALLHLMGTIPAMEGLASRQSPPAEEEPAGDEDSTRQIKTVMDGIPPLKSPPAEEEPAEDEDSTRQIRTALSRVRPAFNESPSVSRARPAFNEGPAVSRARPAFNEGPAVSRARPAFNEGASVSRVRQAFGDESPTRPSNPNFRVVRRAPTPAPPAPQEEPPPQMEFGTEPAQAPALGEEEHVPDTSETPLPHIEPDYEEGTLVNAPAAIPSSPEQPEPKKGGLLLVVLAVGVLLVGAIGLVVALGLDGGRLSSFLSSPAPAAGDPKRAEPLPGKPGRPESKTQQETRAPKQETAAPAPAAAAPSEAAPSTPARSEASPEPSAPAAAASSASPSAETGEKAPPSTEPVAGTPESEPESSLLEAAAPPASAKKTRPPAPKATSIAAPAGTGVLTLVTDPYAKVYLGKRYLGDTPLFKINVPAGKLSLKLVGADGRALKLPVEIKQGETTALKLKLDEIPQQ